MKPGPALGAELVIPALGAGMAIYFFFSVQELAWEAKAMGLLVGGLLAGLIVLQLGRLGRETARRGLRWFSRPGAGAPRLLRERLGIVAVCALFIFVLPWLGLTLGLFLLSATLMRVLNAGGWRSILLTSGVVAASGYLLFVALLNTRVPRGPLEQLLAALF